MAKAKTIKSIITLTHVPKTGDMPDDMIEIDFHHIGHDKKAEHVHDVHMIGQFLNQIANDVLEGEQKAMELFDAFFDRYFNE